MIIEGMELIEVLPKDITDGHFDVPDSVMLINEFAFANCENLESIIIPDSVIYINEFAFSGCDSLTNITVDENNQYYSSEDGVLFNKEKTKLITCPADKRGNYVIPEGVTRIGNGAFAWCENLESITIPDSVIEIGARAFWNCRNLRKINIPDSVTEIDNDAFWRCGAYVQKTDKQPEVKVPPKKGKCR